MKITYYGHSSFLVEARDGTRIILDPYRSGSFGGALRYAPIGESADAVVATHTHDDHGATDTIPGKPLVLVQPTSAKVGGVEISGVAVKHDDTGGSQRGANTIIVLDDGDIRLAHLGDLGHRLTPASLEAIGKVDVVLVPVGGFYTIDAKTAAVVVESLAPAVVIPMHYKTAATDFPIATEDDFLATQKAVQKVGGAQLEVTRDNLPASRTTFVLKPSRM